MRAQSLENRRINRNLDREELHRLGPTNLDQDLLVIPDNSWNLFKRVPHMASRDKHVLAYEKQTEHRWDTPKARMRGFIKEKPQKKTLVQRSRRAKVPHNIVEEK